jgi:hypothetical protein
MSPGQRVDEILRLIDQTLDECQAIQVVVPPKATSGHVNGHQ